MPKLSDAQLQLERDRILERTVQDASWPDGVILRGEFACSGDAGDVFRRVKEMMLMANRQSLGASWPGRRDWADLLSPWFEAACVSSGEWLELDYTTPKPETLPEDQRDAARFDTKWTVDGWLLRMDARRRGWCWRSGEVRSPDQIRVSVDVVDTTVSEMPGELLWLFNAAGASGFRKAT